MQVQSKTRAKRGWSWGMVLENPGPHLPAPARAGYAIKAATARARLVRFRARAPQTRSRQDSAHMSPKPTLPRVASLLPSATEMIAAVGALEGLVGVSHECDWPPEV